MPGHFVKSKNTTEGILNHVLHESIDQLISTARLKLVDRSFMDVNSFLRRKRNYISQISDPLIVALARSFVTRFQLHASPSSSMETEMVWPLLSRVDATARAGVNLHACTYVRAVRCDRSDLRSRSQPVISHWALHGWRHGAVSSFNFCWRKI